MASVLTQIDHDEAEQGRGINPRFIDMKGSNGMNDQLSSRIGLIAVEACINFGLPLLIYDRLAPHSGDVVALMASSLPPLLWSLAEFARRRRIDALSMLVLAGIALSLLAMLGGGSVRLLQLGSATRHVIDSRAGRPDVTLDRTAWIRGRRNVRQPAIAPVVGGHLESKRPDAALRSVRAILLIDIGDAVAAVGRRPARLDEGRVDVAVA